MYSEREERKLFQADFYARAAQIVTVARLFHDGWLPPEHWQAFLDWEKANVDGSGLVGSDEWPGWETFGVSPKRTWERPSPKYLKKPIPQGLRMKVFERDGFKCKSCGAQKDLTADHIIPESKGGETDLDNLQTLCSPCNLKKGDG